MEEATALPLIGIRPRIRWVSRWPAAMRALHADLRFELRALAGLTALSMTGTLAAPFLHDRPLVLMVLSPRLIFLVLAAHQVSLPVFLVVGLVRLMVADPLNFAIGGRVGSRGGALRFINRLPASKPIAAILVLIRPSGPIMAYAGSVGLPGRLAGALDVVSTAVYLTALHVGIQHLFG